MRFSLANVKALSKPNVLILVSTTGQAHRRLSSRTAAAIHPRNRVTVRVSGERRGYNGEVPPRLDVQGALVALFSRDISISRFTSLGGCGAREQVLLKSASAGDRCLSVNVARPNAVERRSGACDSTWSRPVKRAAEAAAVAGAGTVHLLSNLLIFHVYVVFRGGARVLFRHRRASAIFSSRCDSDNLPNGTARRR